MFCEIFKVLYRPRMHREIAPALWFWSQIQPLYLLSGMQPLIPYFKGEKHLRKRWLILPFLGLQDIEEVEITAI